MSTSAVSAYDLADAAFLAAHRADLILQALESVLCDRADGADGASVSTVEIINELTATTRNLLKEAENAASQAQFDLSGAGQATRSKSRACASGPTPTGAA